MPDKAKPLHRMIVIKTQRWSFDAPNIKQAQAMLDAYLEHEDTTVSFYHILSDDTTDEEVDLLPNLQPPQED